MRVEMAIQCTALTGETGSFLFVRCEYTGKFDPVTPVFPSLADLYPYMRENGWVQVNSGYLGEFRRMN